MSNERKRIIEGTWNCSSCGTERILARHLKCPNCNNPREQTGGESNFDFGAQTASGGLAGASVTDEKVLERAKSGPDWYCGFCQTSNAANFASCKNCGAERKDKGGQGEVKELPGPNTATARAAAAQAAAAKTHQKQSRTLKVVFGSVLALFATCGTCSYFGFRTKELTAERVAAKWERTAHRESFSATVARDWRDRLNVTAPVMPVDGKGEVPGVQNIRDCQTKQRGTRKVADGTETVCETKTRKVQCGSEEHCTTKNLGNGFAEETCRDVPKYCSESYESCSEQTRYRDEPVFDEECAYDTFAWERVDTQSLSGGDFAPRWPALEPGAHDRIVREERYEVALRYQEDEETKEHLHQPKDEAEFKLWEGRQQVTIKTSLLGGVEVP